MDLSQNITPPRAPCGAKNRRRKKTQKHKKHRDGGTSNENSAIEDI